MVTEESLENLDLEDPLVTREFKENTVKEDLQVYRECLDLQDLMVQREIGENREIWVCQEWV